MKRKKERTENYDSIVLLLKINITHTITFIRSPKIRKSYITTKKTMKRARKTYNNTILSPLCTTAVCLFYLFVASSSYSYYMPAFSHGQRGTCQDKDRQT